LGSKIALIIIFLTIAVIFVLGRHEDPITPAFIEPVFNEEEPECTDDAATEYIHVLFEEPADEPTEKFPEESVGPISGPAARPMNIIIPMGLQVFPEDFVAEINHPYEIETIEFVYEPYFFDCGEHMVEVTITDVYGHYATIAATLIILPNETPPDIRGVQDIIVRRFGTLMLRQNVTAYDAFGNRLEFFVDSRGVDVDTPGVYEIMYYAYDRWGNRGEAFAYVTVTEVDIEWIYQRIDEILAGITSTDASQVEQARAIHTWMARNVSYSAAIGLIGRYENVYQGLRHRSGNCFVYFYTAEIMLTRLGIPNKRIDRVGGATNHRWHLINPDGLGWHHMDTGPQNSAVANRIDTFMFTSSQAAQFTDLIHRVLGRANYYTYDRELYPEIVY